MDETRLVIGRLRKTALAFIQRCASTHMVNEWDISRGH